MSQYEFVKKVIQELFKDATRSFTIAQIQDVVKQNGLSLSKESTVVRSVLSKMSRAGEIQSIGRGIYASRDYLTQNTDIYQRQNNNVNYEIDGFQTLVPAQNRQTCLAVNILENGHINLNGKLNNIIPSRNITIQFSSDYKQLRLIVGGLEAHTFTKAGTAKNSNLIAMLKKHHIVLPARYIISVTENKNIFLGKIENIVKK